MPRVLGETEVRDRSATPRALERTVKDLVVIQRYESNPGRWWNSINSSSEWPVLLALSFVERSRMKGIGPLE